VTCPPDWVGMREREQQTLSKLPVGRRLCIHPSDDLDSIIPVTDLVQRLRIEYLCHGAGETLVAETARLTGHECHQYTLQHHTSVQFISVLSCLLSITIIIFCTKQLPMYLLYTVSQKNCASVIF